MYSRCTVGSSRKTWTSQDLEVQFLLVASRKLTEKNEIKLLWELWQYGYILQRNREHHWNGTIPHKFTGKKHQTLYKNISMEEKASLKNFHIIIT